MSVRLRFTRVGRPHDPMYRLVATHRRQARDGKPMEVLGTINPKRGRKPDAIKVDRIRYWLSVGATPSDSVRTTLKSLGLWSQVRPGSSSQV